MWGHVSFLLCDLKMIIKIMLEINGKVSVTRSFQHRCVLFQRVGSRLMSLFWAIFITRMEEYQSHTAYNFQRHKLASNCGNSDGSMTLNS